MADTLTIVDKKRTNQAPGKKRTSKHGDGGVEANKHAATDKSRSPFDEPAPVLNYVEILESVLYLSYGV